jgi:hypothetical protein
MKTSVIISAVLVYVSFALQAQAQPKYTQMSSNQSAYKVKDLNGYKETGSKVEDRNAFMNANSYKKSTKVKPEAQELFPVLPEELNQPVFVSENNYKSQFRGSSLKKSNATSPAPIENAPEIKPEGVVLKDNEK